MRRILAPLLGFLSVYLVWILPSYFFGWYEPNYSYAYLYGDHIVLPLFNAVGFWLLAKSGKRNMPTLLFYFAMVVLSSIFLVFFESYAVFLRRTQTIAPTADLYHTFFVLFELSFVLLMTLIYPFLKRAYTPFLPKTILYLLVGAFLLLAFAEENTQSSHPLWQKASAIATLTTIYALTFLWHKIRPEDARIKNNPENKNRTRSF